MPRRATKKTGRKGTKRRHRGGFYGMTGSIGPGAALWSRGSEMGVAEINGRAQNGMIGQGRRKKTRKTRRRRGGSRYGAVYASYPGTGARGTADFVPGTHKPENTAAFGKFNNYGAGPGQFTSFVKAV